MTQKVHPWKYEDPKGQDPNRKGMLLSDEIRRFCNGRVNLLIAENFSEKNLRPAAYTLRIGREFVDSRGKPGRLAEGKSYFEMEPNSIVYVSTLEKLDLPFYIAARFNLRVKWVYRGILLGTGPQVEPGYKGYLSCPLYNLTDQPIRIQYEEDFATIDFERTSDFCPGVKAEEIRNSIKIGNQFDYAEMGENSYILFKQREYKPLEHLPNHDVVSSLVQLSNEVKMWRHIGIGIVVSFFALTLTLLSFGNNLYTQLSNVIRESGQLRASFLSVQHEAQQARAEVNALRTELQRQKERNAAVGKGRVNPNK